MKVLYLDESGDHNLRRINAAYPVFILGGVIADRAYVRNTIEPAMRQFKLRHFERDDIILHTVDMGRGGGDYAFLSDPARRAAFYTDLNQLLQDLEYSVIACAIRKDDHVAKYGSHAADPYMYSLEILIERFCMELSDELDGRFICAEKRNPHLDRELMAAWETYRTIGGTDAASAARIEERIVGLDLRDKKPNLAAMQLADLVITPIGRRVAQKPQKSDQVQWSVVRSKIRHHDDRFMGSGLVIRP